MDNNYKRKWRDMPQTTKDKISLALTGRKLSDETKRKISAGQKLAWSKIPRRLENDNNLFNKNINV